MSWYEIGEIVQAVAPVFTAGAACATAWIAWQGLSKWHIEAIGKRRAELAEDMLTAFYHVRDVLVYARSPFSFENEGEERPRGNDEAEPLARLRNSYYVPIARLNKEAEVFAKLYGNRYRFKAYFGEPADEPFREIHRIRGEIVTAAEALIDGVRHGTPDRDPQFTELKDTIWHRHNKADAMKKSIDVAVKQIEDICRPILQGSAPTP